MDQSFFEALCAEETFPGVLDHNLELLFSLKSSSIGKSFK